MAADLVVSRAGATSISELNACAAGGADPVSHATHNHQFHNAAIRSIKERR